jgi:methyl-accepting chemotaxis protein
MVVRSNQVSVSSGHQSDAAAAMAATVEELTVSIGQITDNAGHAQKASLQAESLSNDGAQVIRDVAAEIRSIAGEITETANTVTALGGESQRISSIVAVIREVAEQTNLLALNAAIEAARAGEQGRGFAVVADEVRKLAERTSNATKEIAGMIKLIQDRSDDAVSGMNRTVAKVSGGVELATRAAEAIDGIAQSAKRAEAAITGITGALTEQTIASGQIAGSVERIAQMTEENSAASKASVESAGVLSTLAQQMRSAVMRFTLA